MKNNTIILIVGLILVVCLFISSKPQASEEFNRIGKYQISSNDSGCFVLDTVDGFLWHSDNVGSWRYMGRPLMSLVK